MTHLETQDTNSSRPEANTKPNSRGNPDPTCHPPGSLTRKAATGEPPTPLEFSRPNLGGHKSLKPQLIALVLIRWVNPDQSDAESGWDQIREGNLVSDRIR